MATKKTDTAQKDSIKELKRKKLEQIQNQKKKAQGKQVKEKEEIIENLKKEIALQEEKSKAFEKVAEIFTDEDIKKMQYARTQRLKNRLNNMDKTRYEKMQAKKEAEEKRIQDEVNARVTEITDIVEKRINENDDNKRVVVEKPIVQQTVFEEVQKTNVVFTTPDDLVDYTQYAPTRGYYEATHPEENLVPMSDDDKALLERNKAEAMAKIRIEVSNNVTDPYTGDKLIVREQRNVVVNGKQVENAENVENAIVVERAENVEHGVTKQETVVNNNYVGVTDANNVEPDRVIGIQKAAPLLEPTVGIATVQTAKPKKSGFFASLNKPIGKAKAEKEPKAGKPGKIKPKMLDKPKKPKVKKFTYLKQNALTIEFCNTSPCYVKCMKYVSGVVKKEKLIELDDYQVANGHIVNMEFVAGIIKNEFKDCLAGGFDLILKDETIFKNTICLPKMSKDKAIALALKDLKGSFEDFKDRYTLLQVDYKSELGYILYSYFISNDMIMDFKLLAKMVKSKINNIDTASHNVYSQVIDRIQDEDFVFFKTSKNYCEAILVIDNSLISAYSFKYSNADELVKQIVLFSSKHEFELEHRRVQAIYCDLDEEVNLDILKSEAKVENFKLSFENYVGGGKKLA